VIREAGTGGVAAGGGIGALLDKSPAENLA